MKKRGSVLGTVLIVSTFLLIFGTAVSSSVVNTTKLNKRYSDTIDLELAAKSGINIVKEDFISKVNSNEINSLDKVNEYIANITSQQSIKSLIEEYSDSNITLTLNLKLDNSNEKNRLEITSVAENEDNSSVEKTEKQSLVLNIGNASTGTGESGGANTGENGSGGSGDTNKGETGTGGDASGDGNNTGTGGNNGILGLLDQDAVLIIPNRNSILAMNHINNGVIVVDEKIKYNNYDHPNNFKNPSGTIVSDVNMNIPKLNITNPIKNSYTFYLTSKGISYDFNFNEQSYYKIDVDGDYQINENYNDFIVVTVNGNLIIQGIQHSQNINKNIIYVVNGDVSLINDMEMLMQGTAIMAKSVKNIGNSKIGFNSGLVITNKIYLPNGHINQLSKRKEAITIIDEIIKGKSIN